MDTDKHRKAFYAGYPQIITASVIPNVVRNLGGNKNHSYLSTPAEILTVAALRFAQGKRSLRMTILGVLSFRLLYSGSCPCRSLRKFIQLLAGVFELGSIRSDKDQRIVRIAGPV
jgi:hypothetical protein